MFSSAIGVQQLHQHEKPQILNERDHLKILIDDFSAIIKALEPAKQEYQAIINDLEHWRDACKFYDPSTIRHCKTFMNTLRMKLLEVMKTETLFSPLTIHDAAFAALMAMQHWPQDRSVVPASQDYLLRKGDFTTATGLRVKYDSDAKVKDKDLINRELAKIAAEHWRNMAPAAGFVAIVALGILVALFSPFVGALIGTSGLVLGTLLGVIVGEGGAEWYAKRELLLKERKRPTNKIKLNVKLESLGLNHLLLSNDMKHVAAVSPQQQVSPNYDAQVKASAFFENSAPNISQAAVPQMNTDLAASRRI